MDEKKLFELAMKLAEQMVRKDNPTPSDVHYDQNLTNISVAYFQNQSDFIADMIFPNIPVQKQSDRYIIFDESDFNRDEMEKRAPATETKGGGWRYSNDSYQCDVWGFHKDLDAQTRANEDEIFEIDRATVIYLTMKALLNREIQWFTNFFKTGVWGTDVVGNTNFTYWDDAASDPIEDVMKAKRIMHLSTGREPNMLVLGRIVFDKLRQHPDVLTRILYTGSKEAPAKVVLRTLQELFEIENILVSNAIYNTAKEGQTQSNAWIAGRNALLMHRAPSPGRMVASAGYTFSWRGYAGQNAYNGVSISRFEAPLIKSERYEIESAYSQKVISANLGYFFSNAVQATV